MFKEFRKFILRGNVIDLAVGIIIGTAFTGIVNSLVNDVLMPPLGILIGGVDFSSFSVTIRAATAESEAVTIGIGMFINALIQFLIIAFAVFLLVRSVNRLVERINKRREAAEGTAAEAAADGTAAEPAAAPKPTTGEKLIEAIRELTLTIRKQEKSVGRDG